MTHARTPEAGRFAELLPWYVNGTLNPADAAWMQQQLAQQGWARAAFEREQALALATVARVTRPAAGDLGLARLMATVAGEIAPPPRGGLARLAVWLAQPRFAAATAALVVAQFGAVLLLSWPGAPEPELTRGGAAAAPPSVKLRFAEGSTEAQMRAALLGAGARIVRGPNAAGEYGVASDVYTPDELAAALRRSTAVAEAVPERSAN